MGTSEVAISIVADSENPPEVGVYAEVDRWAENDWSLHRRGGLCLDVWLCRRELVSPEDETPPDVEVEAIAVGAGDLLWLPTADLRVGVYRVRLTDPIDPRRAQVVGRFDVVEPAAAGVAPPPRSLDGPQLTVSPAVGRARLRHVDIVGVARPQEEGAALWAGIEELPIERWEAGQWASAGSAAVREGPAGRDVGLPDLEDGAYRVLLDTGTGAEGRFWVVDPHAPPP